MRKSVKSGIVAAAVAASALGAGAGIAASAAGPAGAATTAAVVTHQAPVLNTWHQMTLVANGTTYTGYWLLLQTHRGGLLTGWLYDPNLPVGSRYLPVHGSVSGPVVVFGVTYGGVQGSRGFIGTISGGTLSGNWTETGTEGLTGTFTA
jgi:hypothetical protein